MKLPEALQELGIRNITFNVKLFTALLREMCNLIIQQCTNSIEPSAIFQGDPEEQLLKIRKAIGTLNHFMLVTYCHCKTYMYNNLDIKGQFHYLPIKSLIDYTELIC